MISISAKQHHQLKKAKLASFKQRMFAHLNTTFAEQVDIHTLDEQGVYGLIDKGLDECGLYLIKDSDDIKQYLEALLILSPNMAQDEKHAELHRVLQFNQIEGQQKAAFLKKYLKEVEQETPEQGSNHGW